MKINDKQIEFSTGRTATITSGVIGISLQDGQLYAGYDDDLRECFNPPLTDAELLELIDIQSRSGQQRGFR